ncbi:TrbG/VirB9 family P-type conjugative transfer protein [Neisseria musculi]|uniref:Conjugal transfer family protein n=1 Tax=Neisseria musculi TaxID=1815583 RepID=A0A7H1MCS0_9NEIS|nr:TrbG/VirB9 family P-type conjugative transfer protein [Neisseria musculi]QNT59435.1 conjugal transfer family protein [Neisseria musculi]
MINKTLLLSGIAAGFFSLSVQAAAVPKGTAYDRRIQYTDYNPDNVVVIRAQAGRAVLVQLAPDERLSGGSQGLAAGNTGAWHLNVSGNNIFFKPKAASPQTNLLITTNKRTYAFDLQMAGKNRPPTYILRFRYPEDIRKRQDAAQRKRREAQALNDLYPDSSRGFRNSDYWGFGAKSLRPSEMWDDGRFTYLRFNDGREMPTVFKVSDDGTESTVNSHVDKDTLVVHATSALFYLRLGKKVLGVENRSYDGKGRFNYRGTTVPGAIRMKKEGK